MKHSETAGRVLGQLKATVRRNYSSPPSFGAQVVATVLNDAGLKATWQAEVDAMRAHIPDHAPGAGRRAAAGCPGQQSGLPAQRQRGMFSYTGFSAAQVDRLRDEFGGVYLIASGRMCVAGLNSRNVQQVAKAFCRGNVSRSPAGCLCPVVNGQGQPPPDADHPSFSYDICAKKAFIHAAGG